ncbi:hypothetical protein NIES2119_22040 [[Phormidium ambiguum] IAM M-71]|uniref:Endonuclease GajA/Old nuclease/RecF-like AAA domain-containing protein n=1 Tax=[Phormidium ambiguum] IAM M-71 TaxID=454136 RepID=A0A1U7IBP4_9CYAN|nr:AAA family ATPase [Phormidium ambiguum]OKH33973.1 hypothetical protein NIES2119_22040 [Phormidium ambiguum IAM M-71]
MNIKKISVEQLFGIFNHSILIKEDKITIIHGPNGFGKTALLRLIDGLFNAKYSELLSIPFKQLIIEMHDETILIINKDFKPKKVKRNSKETDLTLKIIKPGVETKEINLASDKSIIIAESIARRVPHLEQVSHDRWMDIRDGEILLAEEVIRRYKENYSYAEIPISRDKQSSEWDELRKTVNVYFIQTQRLYVLPEPINVRRDMRRERNSVVLAVSKYSQEIIEAIKEKESEYASLSQSLDRTFPFRLLEQGSDSKNFEDINVISSKLEGLEKSRFRLMEAGLLDKEENVDFQILKSRKLSKPFLSDYAKVLSVYFKDVEQKLGVFDEIANKIDLFREIIESHFTYKKLKIDKNRGFMFSTLDENPFPVENLSSGEQHQLVLLYELLFKIKPGSLILIDEPELSLHVAWQVAFLKDMKRITELTEFDLLLATHSPQIINNRWDLTVELKGP